MGLRRLWDAIRGYGSAPDDFERAIAKALANHLRPDQADRIRRRLASINRVQRLFGGIETTFYQMERGRPAFPRETRILDHPRTIRFAKFRIRSEDQMTRLKGTIYLHAGNLSSIEFDQPTKFADARRIKEIEVEILGPPFIDPDQVAEAAGEWPVGT